MKKLIPFIFVLSFIFSLYLSLSSPAVRAQTTGYGRVLKDNVYIYKNPEMAEQDKIFTLTLSYYVFIIDTGVSGDYYEVQYQDTANGYYALTGFVKKDSVTLWNSPSAPYYPVISAVFLKSSYIYQLAGGTSQILGMAVSGQNVKCYGSIYNESEDMYYYYLRSGTNFGYAAAQDLNVTLPAVHADPMPTPTPSPTQSPGPSQNNNPDTTKNPTGLFGGTGNDNTLQILLIAAICIPALIIVYLMFKPSKKTRYNFKKYYDDGDN